MILPIYLYGAEVLRRENEEVDLSDKDAILKLLEDMKETLKVADGCGLAAPQVGILRRIAIVDDGEKYIELINPEIIAAEGKKVDVEGCLSVPGKSGITHRPMHVTVRALDRNGNEIELAEVYEEDNHVYSGTGTPVSDDMPALGSKS